MNDRIATRDELRFGQTFFADLETAESFSGVDAYALQDPSYQAPTNTFDMVVYDAPYLGGNITGIGHYRQPLWEFFVPTSGEQFDAADAAQAEGNADKFVDIEALKFTNGILFLRDDGTARAVKSLYEGVLGRTADAEGLFFWFNGLISDAVNIEQVTDAFLAARASVLNEPVQMDPQSIKELYLEHHLLEKDYTGRTVKSLYENFLGRTPDAGGFSFWFNGLWSKTVSLDQVTDAFVAARAAIPGAPLQSNQQFVESLYEGFFDGDEDTGFWTSNLDNNLADRGGSCPAAWCSRVAVVTSVFR